MKSEISYLEIIGLMLAGVVLCFVMLAQIWPPYSEARIKCLEFGVTKETCDKIFNKNEK